MNHHDAPSALPSILTVKEVADILRVSKWQVYALVKSGELGAVRLGRSIRVPRRVIDGLLNECSSGPGLSPEATNPRTHLDEHGRG